MNNFILLFYFSFILITLYQENIIIEQVLRIIGLRNIICYFSLNSERISINRFCYD